jgi:hypothetical protein
LFDNCFDRLAKKVQSLVTFVESNENLGRVQFCFTGAK